MLPNLESLHIFCVQSARRKQSKWDLKCTKIELIEIYDAAGFESFLGSLEKCAIKELKYYFDNGENSTVLQKFQGSGEEFEDALRGRETVCLQFQFFSWSEGSAIGTLGI
jgi:hypothetical protein